MATHISQAPSAEDYEHDFRAQIELLSSLLEESGPQPASEKRHRKRYPIYYKMRLQSVDTAGESTGDPQTVYGKNLSTQGISFTHDCEILSNRAVLVITEPQIGRLAVEAEITWSRQTPIGLHESGCRLLRKISWQKTHESAATS